MCPRFLPVSIGVFLLVLSTAVAARAQTEAEFAYWEAKAAFEAGQLEKARDLLVTASQTDAKNPDIYLLLGKAEYQLGNIEEAIGAWRRTLRLAPAQAYARRMLEVLTGQAVDADARLRIVAGLLQDGLLQPAANELTRVRSEKMLSDEQRVELLLLEAEYHILFSQAKEALEALRRLAVRFPDQTQQLRTRLLFARAQVGSGGDLVPTGLAELKSLVVEHADTSEAVAAEVEMILHGLIANPEALPPLVAWIKDHAEHGSAGAARRRLVEAIGKLLSMADPAAKIGPKVELSKTDKLALSTAAEAYPLLVRVEEVQALTQQLLSHVEQRYVANKSYTAAETAVKQILDMPLPPPETAAAERLLTRIAEAVAADAFQDIAFELDQGATETASLVQWIADHADHPLTATARMRLVAAHLSASAKQEKPKAEAQLNPSDLAALSAAGEALKAFQKSEESLELTKQLITHFETRYAANGAFAAATAGLEKLLALPLPPSSKALAQQGIDGVADQVATAGYEKVLFRATQGESVTKDLAAWMEAHPKHAKVAEARAKLIDMYLNATKLAAAPHEDSPLSESDLAAVSVAGQILAERKTAAESLQLTQKLVGHFETHYAARKATAAAIAGVKTLLEFPLPGSSRSHALHALAELQTTVALTRLKTDAARGRIQPGPVPASLAAVLDTYATLNREFPASPTWQLQANLANEVLGLASSVAWPDRVSEPKPPQSWAIEIAMPVVKSGDAAAAKTGVTVVTAVIHDCAAVKQESARGLGTRIHAQLLAVIEPSQETWPAEMLRHVDLLAADAQAIFDENLRTGRGGDNAKLSPPVLDAITTLKRLVTVQPSQGASVLSKIGELLKPWGEQNHYDAVEQAYVALEAALPLDQQRDSKLIVAQLWVKQVSDGHRRLVSAGVQVPRALDPLMQQALVRCYEMERGLPPQHAVVVRARALRSSIIGHYSGLEYFDVAEAAIQVKADEAVDSADAHAELELARWKLATAKRDLDRQLKQYQGREKIVLTEAFKTAVAALKKFLTDRPNNLLAPQAVTELFGIGQTFESYERFEVAVAVYRDIEQFAASVETLMEAAPGNPNTAERAAMAAATALHTQATKALAKRRSKQPADAKPPTEVSEEFAAAIAAYAAVVQDYAEGPLVGPAIEQTKSIALAYAQIDAWDVTDNVYAGLLAQELPFRYPEKLEFARAVCLLGKVMPAHAREVLAALTRAARPTSGPGEEMLALAAGSRPGVPRPGGKPASPGATAPLPDGAAAEGTAEAAAEVPVTDPMPAQAARAKIDAVDALNSLGATFRALDPDTAKREAELLAAVQRHQSTLAVRVAQLRDNAATFNIPQAQTQQSAVRLASAVLSDAEIDRRQEVLDAAYAAFQALTKKHPHTPTALQARGEIMVIVGHWREIGQWQRAADLARRFLADNPRDAHLPNLRREIARDLLAFAGQGIQQKKSKQEMLDEVSQRFRRAREELRSIVSDFPDDDALKHQAQWDIANSYLAQARVVAAFSPTLARGQYVRSADELLRVTELYHDHPQIASIPQMLWDISHELSGKGYFDEAIAVWNELTIHYPMHQLSPQAALRIAQTYQTQLKQPLRAVEAYIELNFARGGADASLQEAVYQIAVSLKNERRWVEALHVLENFTNAFPEHPQAGQALTMIGEIHQTNEVWEDAIEAYERVINEYQNGEWVKQARWAIAECTINLSRWNEAVQAYREFVTSYGEDEKVAEANRRIEILKSLARYQKVVEEVGQRKAFDAQYQIGSIVRSKLSNRVKAIIEFRKVASNWPHEHLADDALYQVGVIYVELGETEKAREALLVVADKYPHSPLADDALFMVGKSHEDEARKLSAVTRTKSIELANKEAQKQAYQISQAGRRMNRERGQQRLTDLKQAGQLEEADNEVANFAARNQAFDYAQARVIANWSQQKAEVLTAQQLADRQDKINAALRKAVHSYRRAAAMVSGDKADDALLRMADIYDKQLKDDEEAMAAWLEIVEQFGGTSVAEDSSWRIAQYYEHRGQHQKAIEAYQKFLHSYRNSSKAGDAMIAVAENYEYLGKWVDAMDAYTNYLNKFPQGPHVERAKEQITWIKTYRL